jgi:hypothetical protein
MDRPASPGGVSDIARRPLIVGVYDDCDQTTAMRGRSCIGAIHPQAGGGLVSHSAAINAAASHAPDHRGQSFCLSPWCIGTWPDPVTLRPSSVLDRSHCLFQGSTGLRRDERPQTPAQQHDAIGQAKVFRGHPPGRAKSGNRSVPRLQ